MTPPPRNRSEILDLARALAAAMVVMGHARSFLFVDYASGRDLPAAGRVFYGATAFGHLAVMVFFVLSGYFVGGLVLRAGPGVATWIRYGGDRLSRLWVVLVPCLFATLLWNGLGWHTGGARFLSGADNPPLFAAPNLPVHLGVGAFLGNLFFLQTLAAPVYGDNGPLWSLAYEFWYYALFPMVVVGVRAAAGTGGGWKGTLWLVPAAALLWALPRAAVEGFAVWVMGAVAAAALDQPASRRLAGAPAFALAAAACLTAAWLRVRWHQIPDLYAGVAFALCLPALVNAGRIPRWLAFLGGRAANFSYTLYLVHFSFAAFIWYTFLGSSRAGFSAPRLLLWAALCSASFAYAYLLSLVFESRTTRVRDWLRRRLSGMDTRRVSPQAGP